MKITTLAILILGLSFAEAVFAQDCPFGVVDDPYPGQCGRYIDADNNGFCDHSQELTLDKVINSQSASQAAGEQALEKNRPLIDYYFWQITLAIGAAWFFSVRLAKMGKLKLSTQRKFWNLMLLAAFLATSATSIIILLNASYGTAIKTPFDLGFWHIETGLAMIIISVLHIFWHIPYFKSYFS
ncbi:MAG TPA: hypothetical protein P5080_04680 [Candidatus Paceibacterota bacterium]|nr:hypothetical protein [Candidatus Pacearchaeota archaeon]HRZ51246.1 hypothetical protein [Candidatus Paceibacterota bacterium]HSA36968.1 hypothetical protein [Candidatus Paceibacterota bacterium]